MVYWCKSLMFHVFDILMPWCQWPDDFFRWAEAANQPSFESIWGLNANGSIIIIHDIIHYYPCKAMENPQNKWRFLAGKIIYKWAIFPIFNLMATPKGFCSIQEAQPPPRHVAKTRRLAPQRPFSAGGLLGFKVSKWESQPAKIGSNQQNIGIQPMNNGYNGYGPFFG